MNHKILNQVSVDLDKLKYDLALIYAKEKLHQALCDGNIIEQDATSKAISHYNEIDFLTESFSFAIQYLANNPDDQFISQLDILYKNQD